MLGGKKSGGGLYGSYKAKTQEAEKLSRSAAGDDSTKKVGNGGREDVCIFSLRHGTGISYMAAAIANYLAYHRRGETSVVLNDTDYSDKIVSPKVNCVSWAEEGTVFSKSNYIVHDCGVHGEMSADRRTALARGSVKIMLCKADGKYLSRLADYVENNDFDNIIFLFNELPAEWEKEVYDLGFSDNVYCVPTFFSMSPSADVKKVFGEIFKGK